MLCCWNNHKTTQLIVLIWYSYDDKFGPTEEYFSTNSTIFSILLYTFPVLLSSEKRRKRSPKKPKKLAVSTLGKSSAIPESMAYSNSKGICADVYTEDEEEARRFIRRYNNSLPFYRQVYKVLCSASPLEKTSTGKIKRKENQKTAKPPQQTNCGG